MEKKIIELDLSGFTRYNDNLARRPEPKEKPTPEIKPAPRKGVRTHSAPKHKSGVRVGWIAAFLAVAALYMVLVSQYMTLTELSLKASDYEAVIRESNEEISKMKSIIRKPLEAGEEELRANPRARSAKLRVSEKL